MLVKRAEAEEFARFVHRNQYYGELPYYVYLKEVYLTLLDFEVKDETILAACWLYNSIEDTSTTYETLLIQFGKEVADLVLAVTNEEGKNRVEKLEKTALKLKDNEKALLLKLVDRVVNTEESMDNDEKLYKMYKKEFPIFRELLYDDKSISYPIIYLWYYLENLYRDEDERLTIEEIENIAKDIYSYNLDQRDLRDSSGRKELEEIEEAAKFAKKYEEDDKLYDWYRHRYEHQKELNELEKEKDYWEEREAEYYDNCYQIVEEKMYDQ